MLDKNLKYLICAYLDLESCLKLCKIPKIINIYYPVLPQLDDAIMLHHNETAKFLLKYNQLTIREINSAVEKDNLEFIKYIISLKYKITCDVPITLAVENDKFEIVKYFGSIGLHPPARYFNWCICRGKIQMLQTLYKVGLKPESHSMKIAIQFSQLQIIKYLESIGECITEDSLYQSVKKDKYFKNIFHISVVDYILSKEIPITDIFIKYVQAHLQTHNKNYVLKLIKDIRK
jgi:hypothetical protein